MRSSHDDRDAAAPLPRAFGPRPLPAARGEVDQERPSSFTTFRGDPSGVRVRVLRQAEGARLALRVAGGLELGFGHGRDLVAAGAGQVRQDLLAGGVAAFDEEEADLVALLG